jgi:hypothetical protein
MPHKDIIEKVHHNSAHLSKDIVSTSQNEANSNVSNSESGSYLHNTRDKLHFKIKSESVHVKTNKSITDSSNHTLHTVSTDPVSKHFLQRDEYKSYPKYESEINLHSENNRSRTHSIKTPSEHHSYSKRWESYKIPREIRETSVSRALRSLRSRSRSVSQSRTVSQSISTIAKQRYGDRASSHCRSSVVIETSDKHIDHALKVAKSDPSAYYLKTQLPKDTPIETSKNLISKPQKKSMQDSEPPSITEAANAKLQHSLKTSETGPGAKMQMSPCVGSTCETGFATVSNLSEHSSFKRSKRAKIVKLSDSETNPREVTNSDLVKNTISKLANEHNQTGGMKRPLETNETEESHLPDSISNETEESHLPDSITQVVGDVTGIEGYNYRENDGSTEHKQKYNGAVKNQPSSSSLNENILKENKFPKEKSHGIQNMNAAVLEERNKANQPNEKTGPKNIKLNYKEGNDKQPAMENIVKETSGNVKIKSGCLDVNETNKNANLKETDQHYGGHAKFRSDRKLFDIKRKSLGSFRPQYISQRDHERSSAQITFNSHCKRRSPSELLNKDRTGRRLNNHNEKARTTRSRSRSFEEGTSMYRETKRYKITDNADGINIRHEASKASSESGKNSRYSRGENNKLNSSQNYKEEKRKQKMETDRLKQNKTSHQEEDPNRNVKNMCLLNMNRSNSVMNSRILDDCSGQKKFMRNLNSSISTTLNEIQKSDSNVLHHELSTLSITNPSGLNEIIKTNISENDRNYFLSKSIELCAEITSARRDSCEKGSQVPRVAENTHNTNSESTDEKCVTHETYDANCRYERKKNKEPEDKNKESYKNYSHKNENNKKGNKNNLAEVEQIKQISTKESGKEVHNFQKENLLESSTEDSVMDGHCLVERLEDVTPDTVTKTQTSDCMEQQQPESSKHPITEPLAPDQILKAGSRENSLYYISRSSSVESVELRDRKCVVGRDVADSLDETCIKKINDEHSNNGRKKSGSSDNAEGTGKNIAINVTKNKISNRKEAKSDRHEEHGENVNKSFPNTNEKGIIMKSEMDNGCKNPVGCAVKGMEDVIQIMVNEIHNTGFKKPQHGSSSQPITEKSICDEANKTGKARRMVTCSRSRPSEEEERMLKDSIIYKTSDISDSKCTNYITNKAVSEKETNKNCERTEKVPVIFQKYPAREQNTVYGTEIETIPTVPQKNEVFDNLSQEGTKCKDSENEYKKNKPDSCRKNEENKQSAFNVSQIDLINAKGSEMRQKYENYSKTVQLDKNTEGGEATVDEVKDNAPVNVNEKLKSCCKESKNGLSDNYTTKPSLASNENENENENNRTRRLRSRSHEDRSQAMRRPQKHNMTHSIEERCAIRKTDSVQSDERKNSKYSKDKNKKLSISQKDKEIAGKKASVAGAEQIGADNTKYTKTTRKEEKNSKNVHKISLLESNNVHILTCTKPETQNCSEGQIESVKGMKDVKLNEANCKEMQNGKYREPITELSVSHEVLQKGVAEIIPKSVFRDNSDALSAESSTVSPVINLKFRTRRSVENKLEDSKAVLSVNITPPKANIAECPGTSAVKN